jgi:hypothetical protein
MSRATSLLVALGALAVSSVALAQPPSPIPSEPFVFPSAVRSPASAISASVAMSDRWLGDEPFDNPALGTRSGISLSPLLQRVNRQDLRADNRDFDEESAFFDFAGAWIGAPIGPVMISAYGFQPGLRLERNAFARGELGAPGVQPGTLESSTTAREMVGGVSGSFRLGVLSLGAAAEGTFRNDRYETTETSGSPTSGTRSVDFSGSAFGYQVGARAEFASTPIGPVTIGAAGRYLPEIEVTGERHEDLLVGSLTEDVSATRAAGWEGGVSIEDQASPAFRIVAGSGGRTAQDWDGFGVTAGETFTWSVGGEYHDARDPWSVSFGGGQEQMSGSLESRAGMFGLGFGWISGDLRLDLGGLRRSIERNGEPNSYDYRIVGTVRLEF